MDIKKIIIIGSTGFIGSRLRVYLGTQFPNIRINGYSTKDIDLADESKVQRFAKEFDLTTAVVMCSMVKKEYGDNLDSYKKNLAMIINLCQILEKFPVKRFLYLSSAAVYGEDVENINISEQTCVRPTSYYGMAKFASENLLQKVFSVKKECSLLILRPPLIYGPGDRSLAYGPAGFVTKVLANEKIVLWGDGRESREFVYIDDLMHIVGRMVLGGYAGTVNVVSGIKYSFRDVLDIIERRLKLPLQLEERQRTKQKANHCFDNDLIKKLLPDVTFTTLDQGIQQMMKQESNLAHENL